MGVVVEGSDINVGFICGEKNIDFNSIYIYTYYLHNSNCRLKKINK